MTPRTIAIVAGIAGLVLLFGLWSHRYWIEASGAGGMWQLDRLTGAVRFCSPNSNCQPWQYP